MTGGPYSEALVAEDVLLAELIGAEDADEVGGGGVAHGPDLRREHLEQ